MRQLRVEQERKYERNERPAQVLRRSKTLVETDWQETESRMEKEIEMEKKAGGCLPDRKVVRVVLSMGAPSHRHCCRRRSPSEGKFPGPERAEMVKPRCWRPRFCQGNPMPRERSSVEGRDFHAPKCRPRFEPLAPRVPETAFSAGRRTSRWRRRSVPRPPSSREKTRRMEPASVIVSHWYRCGAYAARPRASRLTPDPSSTERPCFSASRFAAALFRSTSPSSIF